MSSGLTKSSNRTYWKTHYVVNGNADEIERHLAVRTFCSGAQSFELLCFITTIDMPNVLISPGSGGHAYVFAELGYELHRRGYNVFIMPRHGGLTVSTLMTRHQDALEYVARNVNPRVGVYAEGLGGYVAFYLALAHAPMKSLVCENSPAVLTDRNYYNALLTDSGPWTSAVRRRKLMLPLMTRVARITPTMRIPIWSYLDWSALIDRRAEAHDTERMLVEEGYLHAPDFDRWYPLSHVMSLLSTPPPNPVSNLRIPTMFVVADGGPTPAYIKTLFSNLPLAKKRLHEVEGSVYWMLSHPSDAADLAAGWFDETV